jgi:hypothetical protein
MARYHKESFIVLFVALALFLLSSLLWERGGGFLRHVSLLLTGIVALKGASGMRCKTSDILLSSTFLILIGLSKFISPGRVSPAVFQISALVIVPIFLSTGLTLKAIVAKQSRSENH